MEHLLDEIFVILDSAYNYLEILAPKLKKVERCSKSILDINPLDIPKFMEENNIPSNAEFQGVDNGYDGFNDFVLSWDIKVPTNVQDKVEYIKRRYETYTYPRIYRLLKKEGYEHQMNYKNSHITLYNVFETKNRDLLKSWINYKFS